MQDSAEKDRALEYLADIRFHQSFFLPPNPSIGRSQPLRITYSDYGYHDDNDSNKEEAVILFCGPMLGSRYLHLAKDRLAKQYRVRIINPDRPGIGGSGEVAFEERVKVWLETVPALLRHLDIKHVALVGQSGGTIYALNTLLYLPHILHPTRPYVALCAPWVHPSRSGATAMQLMKIFPNQLVGHLHSVAQFFHAKVAPVTGFSSSIISTILPGSATVMNDSSIDGESATFEDNLRPMIIDFAYAENIQGISQEALLFLKRGNAHDWGPWEDYDKYVPMLASLEPRDMKAENLKIDVYYAESDVMIGSSRGPRWFDDCWRPAQRGSHIDYSSSMVKNADHDGILNLRFGCPQQVFAQVTRSFGLEPTI